MNVVFCFDNNYVLGYLATAVSLFENNKDNDIVLYILSPDLKKNSKDKFDKLALLYGKKIEYRIIEDWMFDGLPIHPPFNKATYYRYLIPDLCEVSKVLQLDGDLIVRKDLTDLYNFDISKVAMAVVEDHLSDNILEKNRLCIDGPLFNNGVQLMNLDFWRARHISAKCKEFLISHPQRCIYMDQDANNVILHDNVIFLPYTYNIQGDWFNSDDQIYMHRDKIQMIKKDRVDPVIVHFSKPLKPWHKECQHPFKHEFLRYARMYDFIEYRESYRFPLKYRIIRKLIVILRKLLHNQI